MTRFWANWCLCAVLSLGANALAQSSSPAQPGAATVELNAPEPQYNAEAHLGHFAPVRPKSTSASMPNNTSYRPLTDREKFEIFKRDAESPLTFISAGFTAGYNSLNNRVYGESWSGWGENYAAAVAEHETSSFLGNFLFPTLLNQDPRYHPSEKEGFWKRSTYAASRVLITKNDFGQKTVNTSYLLGALVSTAIGNLYRPSPYRSTGQTMVDFGSTVGGDAGMNLVKEFWPEVSRILHPMTPKKLRKLEDRMIVGTPPLDPDTH